MPNLLEKARLKRRLTRAQVAKALGVTEGFIGHLERGDRKPSPRKAIALESVLGVDRALILPEIFSREPA